MPFSLPSPSSLVLLSSSNSATMVTWRHTSLDWNWTQWIIQNTKRILSRRKKKTLIRFMSPYLRESGFRNPRKFCLWNQESRKFLFVESEILGFRKRNTAQGIRNPLMIAIGNPLPNFHWQRIWNPVSGIRNPRRGIQNLRLSGFHYLRRFMNDFYRFGRYFCWQVARLMSGTGEYRKTGRMKKKKKSS